MSSVFNVENRRALVVGGSGALGHTIAAQLEDAGAKVVTADLAGSGAQLDIDVSNTESVQAAVVGARQQLGGSVEILVNAAGVQGRQSEITEMDDADWVRVIDINLTGVMRVSRAVAAEMKQQRWGRIIHVASQLGIKGAGELAHYTAAKGGVITFTKSLAIELAPHNVLVNSVAPGPFETPMLASLSDEWRAKKLGELPLGRFGLPEEVAPTVLLLAGEPSGNIFVGQTLGPNSGDVMP
ncbi:MAG: SDR family NAD(P)-dependent oxidoreductase [Microterricola sp.]